MNIILLYAIYNILNLMCFCFTACDMEWHVSHDSIITAYGKSQWYLIFLQQNKLQSMGIEVKNVNPRKIMTYIHLNFPENQWEVVNSHSQGIQNPWPAIFGHTPQNVHQTREAVGKGMNRQERSSKNCQYNHVPREQICKMLQHNKFREKKAVRGNPQRQVVHE